MSLRDDVLFALRPILRAVGGHVPVPDTSGGGSIFDVSLLGHSQPSDFPIAYRLVPTINFCISLIQQHMAAVPLCFYMGDPDEGKELERQPGNIVDLWRSANAQETGYDLIEQIIGSLLINGNAFLFKEYMGTNRVQEFWCLPGNIVTPVPGPRRTTLRYDVWVAPGAVEPIPPDQILHIKMYDPEHGVWRRGLLGLSPLQVLQLQYETQRDAARFLRAFFGRGGIVGGHYKTDQTIEEGDRARLKLEFRRHAQGPENALDPVILPRKLEFVRAGLTMQEMDFLNSGKFNESHILQVYKVPPLLAGHEQARGMNSDMARVSNLLFLQNAIMPMARRIEAAVNENLLGSGEFGANLKCEFDFSGVPAAQYARLEQLELITKITGVPVMSREEGREEGGLPDDIDGTMFVPITMAPDESDSTPDANEPVATPAPATPSLPEEAATRRARTARREAIRRAEGAKLTVFERRAAVVHRRRFTRQERTITALLKKKWPLLATQNAQRFVDLNELLDAIDRSDVELVRKLLRAIMQDRGDQAIAELGLELTFNLNATEAMTWLETFAASQVSLIDSTTRERLREALMESVKQGYDIGETTRQVREVFDQRRDNALTIARTETAPAYNFAAVLAWGQSGVVESKEWLTAGDEHVREWHAAAEGQTVALDDSFTVDDEQLDYPGDPNGSAENVINCRCTVLPVLAQPDEAAVMPDAIAQRLGIQTLEEFFGERNGKVHR